VTQPVILQRVQPDHVVGRPQPWSQDPKTSPATRPTPGPTRRPHRQLRRRLRPPAPLDTAQPPDARSCAATPTPDGGTSSATAGGDYTGATGDLGNNDIAYVFDPSSADGSNATAGFDSVSGLTGNSDLAAVLGVDNLTANAIGANDLVDILPTLSAEATSASSTFVTDLLPLF
jgi:hypothetical protein